MGLTNEEMVTMGLLNKIDRERYLREQSDKDADYYRTLSLEYLDKIHHLLEMVADEVTGRTDAD